METMRHRWVSGRLLLMPGMNVPSCYWLSTTWSLHSLTTTLNPGPGSLSHYWSNHPSRAVMKQPDSWLIALRRNSVGLPAVCYVTLPLFLQISCLFKFYSTWYRYRVFILICSSAFRCNKWLIDCRCSVLDLPTPEGWKAELTLVSCD